MMQSRDQSVAIAPKWVTAVALAFMAVVMLSACGDSGTNASAGSAGDAVKRLFDMVNKGQWGPEWDMLHPTQQQFIPRDLYIQCAEKQSLPNIDGVKVLDTYEETVAIPGANESARSTAVTVELRLRLGTVTNTTKDTFHVFLVDGGWRWMLADVDAFKEGKCP